MLAKLLTLSKNTWLSHAPCMICRHPNRIPFYLCRHCLQALPFLETYCPQCFALKHTHPSACISPFHQTFGLFYYQEPIKTWLRKLKFENQLFYSFLLGQLMARALKKFYRNHPKPEVILPVPLYSKRQQTRGYNQTLEVAKKLNKVLKLPIDNRLITKIRNTPPQTTLTTQERKTNLQRAFEVSPSSYHHVALLDDVYTTGTTVNTIGKRLLQQKIAKIDLWIIARSPHLN